jgi:hypothetical protein
MPDAPAPGLGHATEGRAVFRRLLTAAIVLAPAGAVFAQSPAARLGSPVPSPTITVRAAYPDDREDPPPAAKLGAISTGSIGKGPDNATDDEKYNWGVPKAKPASRTSDPDSEGGRSSRRTPGKLTSQGPADGDPPPPPPPNPGDPTWWPGRRRDLDDLRGQFPSFGAQDDRDRLSFQSDCAFDNFSSPITNPFLAEDPRSLTELRPVYFYQGIPSGSYYLRGGHLSFIGVQARAAFTDRFSVAVTKLGFSSLTPDNPLIGSGTGFSEIWLTPKFVFWRDPDTQTLATFGMQFQMPIGSGKEFQDTGGLGLVPFVSFGRMVGKTDYGSFHLINVAGYNMSTSASRTDFFFDSIHLDLDANDDHRFFPSLELNWFHNTTAGTSRSYLFFEGRDWANIGANAAGRDLLTIAPGFRYRFTDYLQMGFAVEFPLAGTRDLFQYRIGVDLIWRY